MPSVIPEEIKKFRPGKCTRIRNDNGVFRVYKYKAKKLPSGKWGADQGVLIGKIVPGVGFCPNKRYMREQQAIASNTASPIEPEGITDVAYGQYGLLMSLSADVKEKLLAVFPAERAMQLYCYALILCANGFVYIDQIEDFYQESFLSVQFKDYSFRLGKAAVRNLLHDLGLRGTPVERFEQSLIDGSSKDVAIDGHVVRSCSENNDLAEPGYKHNAIKAPQINLLIAYDIKNKVPLMYRAFRGSCVDKRSVVDLLESRSFKDTKFVVDRGFYSSEVLALMSKDGNRYIIPVPSQNKDFKRIKSTLEYSSGEFIYQAGRKNSARIVFYEERISSDVRIIVYKDVDENNSKRKSYQLLLDAGEEGYTQEKYDEYCQWWGVYFLQTNTEESAPDVFRDYKHRWSIETYNNYIKNDGEFRNLKIQDYYVEQGFNFVMLVTGLIHSRLNEAVRKLGRASLSTIDVLIRAGHMRMAKDGDVWNLRNTRTKDLQLLAELKFTPEKSYPASTTMA